MRRLASSPGSASWVLANVALHLNDTHIDLTREKVYTPSATAMEVVDELRTPVRITYFYRSQDPDRAARAQHPGGDGPAQSAADGAHRRSRQAAGARAPRGRAPLQRRHRRGRRPRVLIQGTDEAEIAIGIQRVLRTRSLTVCFLEGHGELPMDNFEFHTHVEGAAGPQPRRCVVAHRRDAGPRRRPAAPRAGGAGLRRPQGGAGDEPARSPAIARCSSPPTRAPRSCRRKARRCGPISRGGGNALLLFDLGFVPEPGLSRLLVRPRRPARAGGGRRSAEPLPPRSRDGGGDRLRAAPDHPHPVADLLSRHPAADADEAGGRRGGDAAPPEQPRQLRPAGGARGGAHDRAARPPAATPGRARRRPTCGRACWASPPRGRSRRARRRCARWSSATATSPATPSCPTWRTATCCWRRCAGWRARSAAPRSRTRIPVPPMILLTGAQSRMALRLRSSSCCRWPWSAIGGLVWWRRR